MTDDRDCVEAMTDAERAASVVHALHGLLGFDAWARCVAAALATVRAEQAECIAALEEGLRDIVAAWEALPWA